MDRGTRPNGTVNVCRLYDLTLTRVMVKLAASERERAGSLHTCMARGASAAVCARKRHLTGRECCTACEHTEPVAEPLTAAPGAVTSVTPVVTTG